jgi:phosphohistidine swiveling domain-containing protein
MQDQTYPQQILQPDNTPLIQPLNTLNASAIGLAGGKGANLGELIGAGLPVPDGFCITTAAYDLVNQQAELGELLDDLAATQAGDIARLEHDANELRQRLGAVAIPAVLVEALRDAYQQLAHDAPVAVRSSATAEDLPFASFAGQQDTLLNVIGFDALLNAVRRCWASLWNDRAVSYRASNNIDPRTVRLAVVVQRMVNATVAGVLFTANPLTGRRRQAVIDASPGLGEAVVSGAVTPDHFVVNTQSGEIVERSLGQKRLLVRALTGGGTEQQVLSEADETSCLTDEQIRALAKLGARVEDHFGAPQDTEWAIDDAEKLWLTQARPITTLYPLPTTAPINDDEAHLYLSLNVIQGVYRPFTPMGVSFFRLMGSAAARMTGFPPRDLLAGPPFMQEAGLRIFLDVTPMFRRLFWRRALIGAMGQMEVRSGPVLEQLTTDPRFSPLPMTRRSILRKLIPLLLRTRGLPLLRIAQGLFNPPLLRERFASVQQRIRAWSLGPLEATPRKQLHSAEQGALELLPYMFPNLIPVVGLVFGLPALARQLLRDLATEDEIQTVRRGLPYNPTTEMDLQLWQLAQHLREDKALHALFHEQQPTELAQAYHAGTLPAPLQRGLAEFLTLYGHRGVAEIDLGLPRWSEDPSYLLGMLANYIALNNPDAAPDAQFQRSVQEAEAMMQTLIQRARRQSWLRGWLTSLCLHRLRELTGLREVPKFNLVLIIAGARRRLFAIGEELTRCQRLDVADDIFFITLQEAHDSLAGRDMRDIVRERHESYERELKRHHIPRIMLSDGTEPEALTIPPGGGSQENAIQGAPASPGVVTGKARVILDPAGARLEPGEILVAPSTDPGWTPLFFTASGLVMEMGGSMSHGAIVAREYGIPAVVGVSGAIERITTGQQITIDGSRGIITLDGK